MIGRTACAALLAATVVAGLAACKQAAPDKKPAPSSSAPSAGTPSQPSVPLKGIASGAGLNDAAKPAGDRVPTLEFPVPKTVSVGKSDEISFVFQGASIEPRNPESVRVVLLVRMQNRSAYATNFWDASFRLLTHNAVIAASGGLNVLVDGRSDSALERVQFVVPTSSGPRALKIEYGGESVELPLRFS